MNQTLNGALQGLGKVLVPAASLACGAVVKLILNLLLIRNPNIGIYGAAISSVIASITVTTIEITILTKLLSFDSNKKEMLLKPLMATIFMGIAAWGTHFLVSTYIVKGAIATLIAIVMAVIVYGISLLKLEVFSREDYHMLPYGDKIHKVLEKLKLVKP